MRATAQDPYTATEGEGGTIRSNLSGRGLTSGVRTVISPDPNLGINEVNGTRGHGQGTHRADQGNEQKPRTAASDDTQRPRCPPRRQLRDQERHQPSQDNRQDQFIWSGFRCLNSQCHSGSDDEPYPGMRPDLNSVLPPNFLPGLRAQQEDAKNASGETSERVGRRLGPNHLKPGGEDERGRSLPGGRREQSYTRGGYGSRTIPMIDTSRSIRGPLSTLR